MGHASRLIPLIYKYRNEGYNVLISGSGKSADLLKRTFTDIPFIPVSSIPVYYFFRETWFVLNILLQLPALIYNTIHDYLALRKLIPLYSISVVISDNRYGLNNPKIRSIIITHQISPVLPRFLHFLEYLVYKLVICLVERFDECWIPDFKGDHNLSGKLSHRFVLPSNALYIGPLSRFGILTDSVSGEKFDNVIILSGPQPELGRLTRKILFRISGLTEKSLVITGLQEISGLGNINPSITIVSHLDPALFRYVLENANLIISTAGYSGIMDLFVTGCTAILIPFKGQTEQEYLCCHLQNKELFITLSEDELDFRNSGIYKEKLNNCRMKLIALRNSDLPDQEYDDHN